MNTQELEDKIKYLEKIIELQQQLLAQKNYPAYVPYPYPIYPPYDPWRPWKPYYYEAQPTTVCTTTAGEYKWQDMHAMGGCNELRIPDTFADRG